jgi:hypothetical protein
MAALLAAGAASCAGYFIGKLAVSSRTRKNKITPVPRLMVPTRYHLPPRPVATSHSSFYSSPLTGLTAGGGSLMPAPRRVLPGQCALCESWFQHGDVVAKLYCGHVFHRVCVETAARQPVYENFRCTCVTCHGGSWITRFAVTELNAPREPSVAPPIPLPRRRTRSEVSDRLSQMHVPIPVAEPVAATLPAAATLLPASAHVAKSVPVNDEHSSLMDVGSSSSSTESVAQSDEDDKDDEVEEHAAAIEGKKETRELTFISFDAPHASCTLCKCSLCAEGKDGNCDACGRCKCYECVYNMCECGCRCAAKEFSVLSLTSFVPLY